MPKQSSRKREISAITESNPKWPNPHGKFKSRRLQTLSAVSSKGHLAISTFLLERSHPWSGAKFYKSKICVSLNSMYKWSAVHLVYNYLLTQVWAENGVQHPRKHFRWSEKLFSQSIKEEKERKHQAAPTLRLRHHDNLCPSMRSRSIRPNLLSHGWSLEWINPLMWAW